jgi:hypothetical protein
VDLLYIIFSFKKIKGDLRKIFKKELFEVLGRYCQVLGRYCQVCGR